LAAAQDNAADLVAAGAAGRHDDLLAILLPVDALDLPDVRLDPRVLQLVDGFNHQGGAELEVVGLLVVAKAVGRGRIGWPEEFEHEQASARVQVVRELPQAGRLAPVQGLVAPRVVAHEYLAEGRVELFDVAGEVRAVLEIELVLATLLRGAG